MQFDGLSIRDATDELKQRPMLSALLQRFPDCRIFSLRSSGLETAHVVAAACLFGEDTAPAGANSMFPMMSGPWP
jgi:hypothetical protein